MEKVKRKSGYSGGVQWNLYINWKKWKSRKGATDMNYMYQLYNYHIMCIELSWLI